MLLDAMRAYTERDARLASEVIDRDDEVDKLYKRSIKLLQEEMQQDPELVRSGTRYLFVLASSNASVTVRATLPGTRRI